MKSQLQKINHTKNLQNQKPNNKMNSSDQYRAQTTDQCLHFIFFPKNKTTKQLKQRSHNNCWSCLISNCMWYSTNFKLKKSGIRAVHVTQKHTTVCQIPILVINTSTIKCPWSGTVPSCSIRNGYLKNIVINQPLNKSLFKVDLYDVRPIDLKIFFFSGAFHTIF